jgi:predicted lipoprotein with Yx(FWY)xxD motif
MKHRLASFAAAAALVALVLPGIVAAADTQVVAGKVIGTHGTLMVASSNQMTVYTFDKDVAGSGVSNCSGGCLAAWPALTIAAGATPTGDATVTGTLGTITRTDASTGSAAAIQVTYNGKPLYFFAKDAAPGDAKGIYPGWQAVVLVAPVPTQVVAGKVIAKHGTLLVASANQMTVYTFDKDVADSGVSNCSGGCLTAWPALTITPGSTPTAGAGVTGKLGTITRADNGALQITYDGKPLYFFAKDAAPGDANGIYPGWQGVVLAAEATPTPAPTATPQAATPPPTSTSPTGTGSPNGSDQVPALLFAGLAVLGFVVAARRLAAIRA